CQRAPPGGAASALATRSRSATRMWVGASRTGQALRAWNQTLLGLWSTSRGAGRPRGCSFLGPRGSNPTISTAFVATAARDPAPAFFPPVAFFPPDAFLTTVAFFTPAAFFAPAAFFTPAAFFVPAAFFALFLAMMFPPRLRRPGEALETTGLA